MKKKLTIVGLILAFAICLLPIPRNVDCDTENVVIDGTYFDFLFLRDRFVGKGKINGAEYVPFGDHSASKMPDDEGKYYAINLCRYDSETNSIEMETVYLAENLKGLADISVLKTDKDVAVTGMGIGMELYEIKTFATVYENGEWLSAQGTRASIELPNIADKIMSVTWNDDIQVYISKEVELYYIDIFDENFEKIERYDRTLEELKAFFTEAEAGQYYVAVAVNRNGEYIPKEEKYESYGSEYVFGVVKEQEDESVQESDVEQVSEAVREVDVEQVSEAVQESDVEQKDESAQESDTNSKENNINETAVDDLILGSDFSDRYMSRADFLGFRVEELRLIRNGIYAKKGAIFQSEDLNRYFGSKPWYHGEVPVSEFPEAWISGVERANLELLKEMEAAAEEHEATRKAVADLPEAPYLQYLDQYRETGMEADMNLAEDMGIYYTVPGVIKHPVTFTEEQRQAMENGEDVAIVVDEVSGETKILRKYPGSAPNLNVYLWYEKGTEPDADTEVISAWFDMESGIHTLWHFSDDTIMKNVYEGDIYILKGAVTGAHLSLELASADQREITIPASNTEPWKTDVSGNYLFHDGKGYFTAVYYLGD